ncbi:MAG: Rid family detoxifying hydrolase [Nitrososphaerota archaeon]
MEFVYTEKAPKPVGPYSQAVKIGNMVFVSGQLGIDPSTGKLIKDDIELQMRRAFMNVASILEAAGSNLSKVVKVTVYLKDPSYFKTMNEVYVEFFRDYKPARTTVIASPPIDEAVIEVDVIAYLD